MNDTICKRQVDHRLTSDTEPRKQVAHSDQVLCPVPDFGSSTFQETCAKEDEGNASNCQKSHPRHLVLVGLEEDSRSLMTGRQSIKNSSTGEKSVVSGGEDRGEEDDVHETCTSLASCFKEHAVTMQKTLVR